MEDFKPLRIPRKKKKAIKKGNHYSRTLTCKGQVQFNKDGIMIIKTK